MKVRVHLFALYRERLGCGQVEVELPAVASVEALLQSLVETYPSLARLVPNTMVAVNQEYAGRSDALHEGDEVALIPPVSGGRL
ncbi:MAG: molybdopterin converting factor subunit 1 [Chloroflexi bacterium]|nr:molybdopterin converting factor subunit 1 [Chloroflexota bacterium]